MCNSDKKCYSLKFDGLLACDYVSTSIFLPSAFIYVNIFFFFFSFGVLGLVCTFLFFFSYYSWIKSLFNNSMCDLWCRVKSFMTMIPYL